VLVLSSHLARKTAILFVGGGREEMGNVHIDAYGRGVRLGLKSARNSGR
jgi:hypothetical protein